MKITKTCKPKAKPDFTKLGFGKYFTDHMLLMEYHDGAWNEPQIIPYDDFKMNPATNILHYGQGIFEGVKAYKDANGKITTFRIDENIKRKISDNIRKYRLLFFRPANLFPPSRFRL